MPRELLKQTNKQTNKQQVHPSSLEYGGAPLLELCKAGRLFLQQESGTVQAVFVSGL
jgi:hypothetical protein